MTPARVADGTPSPPASTTPVRTLVVWVPDWPVHALLRERGSTLDEAAPIAVVRGNRIVACSERARAQGVRRGQRRRDAQAACPGLHLVPDDEARDNRGFLPVVSRIEQHAPGVQIVRAGLGALRARGPARYYGGEDAAARVLQGDLARAGLPETRVGIGDGPFTAEQAARLTSPDAPVRIVPPGEAGAFLAPLSVRALADDEIIGLLARLGVQTLGAFAELDEEKVRERFADRGIRLHRLARGLDARTVTARTPPPELEREVSFEPPLELVDQIGFAVRVTADAFISALSERALVCTELRVELLDDRGGRSERVWLHPTTFDAAAVVDRVRWQLEAAIGGELTSGVSQVRLAPESVDEAAHHEPGLFGQGPGERVHHALSRVQAMLGHRGVLTPAIGGGRSPAERQVLVPWGDRVTTAADRGQPWPGSLPAPHPTTVYAALPPIVVLDAEGAPVTIDARGRMSAPPASLGREGRRRDVAAWAGPWALRERDWDPQRRRLAYRVQAVDDRQEAWLLVYEDEAWHAEGRYD
ncbi:DNA polymerase Y family protein [Microbacterium limosum]|uniref:DNA polymerase Y family protein n=1 Tax=Microbacterium limosum TaxID=3079935 RepID=A0AAU0MII2_9MICO|nr:DNA polymerase Y family protein [Microbacterium sp. Y20]WOQ70414.1 DNA polymerase Y family protein [Microbacterium sp. Y20]